jgi:hypothetical protein
MAPKLLRKWTRGQILGYFATILSADADAFARRGVAPMTKSLEQRG